MNQQREFTKTLSRWYETNGRSFPWRVKGLPLYRVLVTEILLWKTRVETIADFYHRFFEIYPDEKSLAASSLEEITRIIQPLGLQNRRAKTLKQVAENINKGKIMDERSFRKTFGVGQYIARATLAFHYGVQVIPVDENVKRLLGRVFGFNIKNIRSISRDEDIFLSRLIPEELDKMIWAIIDYSSITCTRNNPACHDCIFNNYCAYLSR